MNHRYELMLALALILAPAGKAQTAASPSSQPPSQTTDRQLTQRLRKAVMADKSYSASAHNIKITSQHGRVTLRGPVRTHEEKDTLEAKAVEIAGPGNVDNQLTVAPR